MLSGKRFNVVRFNYIFGKTRLRDIEVNNPQRTWSCLKETVSS